MLQQSKLTPQAPPVGMQQKPETWPGSLLQTAGAQQSAERVQARCTPKQQTPSLQIWPLGQSAEEVQPWASSSTWLSSSSARMAEPRLSSPWLLSSRARARDAGQPDSIRTSAAHNEMKMKAADIERRRAFMPQLLGSPPAGRCTSPQTTSAEATVNRERP